MSCDINVKKGLYKNFIGDVYKVIGIALNTEDAFDYLVIYHPKENPKKLWACPLIKFFEDVEIGDEKTVKRFVFLED